MALWHALKKLGDVALSRVGSEIEAATRLSGADFGILSRLEDLGGGKLDQRDLLASLGWHKSRLSHQLTRMEARGLLRRKRLASGRGVAVMIRPQGAQAIATARPIHAAAVRKHVLLRLAPEDEQVILRLADRFHRSA